MRFLFPFLFLSLAFGCSEEPLEEEACRGTSCGGTCVDTTNDVRHCGDCNTSCGVNEVCTNGGCVCDQTQCGSACIDTRTSTTHCGGCDRPCQGQCVLSSCVCPSPLSPCNGDCVDLSTDPNNCGICERVCPSGVCEESGCVTLRCVEEIRQTDIRLTDAPGLTSYPSIVPTASGFALAFDDDRANPGTMFYNDRQVFFATYDADGSNTGVEAALTSTNDNAVVPDLVSADGSYALVYEQEGDIYFVRVDESGQATDGPTAIATGLYGHPRIAWSGTGFGVTYSGRADTNDDPHVWFLALELNGTPVGSSVTVSETVDSQCYDKYAKIVWNGTAFGIAWQGRPNGFWEIFFRLVAADGTMASNTLQVTTAADSVSSAVQIIWNEEEFGLVYADTRDTLGLYEVYLARIAADGSSILSEQKVSDSTSNSDTPGVLYWQNAYWVVWVEKPYTEPAGFAPAPGSPAIDAGVDLGMGYNGAAPDIGAIEFGSAQGANDSASVLYLSVVTPSKVGTPVVLSNNSGFSAFPALAPVGDEIIVVWFDSRDGGREIYGARLGCLD